MEIAAAVATRLYCRPHPWMGHALTASLSLLLHLPPGWSGAESGAQDQVLLASLAVRSSRASPARWRPCGCWAARGLTARHEVRRFGSNQAAWSRSGRRLLLHHLPIARTAASAYSNLISTMVLKAVTSKLGHKAGEVLRSVFGRQSSARGEATCSFEPLE